MTALSRRRFVQLGAGALAAGWRSPARAAEASAGPPLRNLAAAAGLRFGSDSDVEFGHAPPEYGQLFARECALYACWFAWSVMYPRPGMTEPANEDHNIAFAHAHQMPLTGGHLLWHETDPDWLKTLDRAAMEQAVRAHIADLGRRYGAQCYSWNVVNEALEPGDGRPDGLKNTLYVKTMGPDFFDLAFHAARDAAPEVLRVYNDYGLEMDESHQEAKRAALLRLLDGWLARGTPVDAVGLQSHLQINGSVFDAKKFRAFLKEIASRGLKILITELDVLDFTTPPDTAARDRAVADFYARYLDAALEEPAVKAVVTWGLSDRYSWLNDPYFAWAKRKDKLPARPLPYDEQLQPKPAFAGLQGALQRAPRR
jgi:endo-1,4-beta-xylanase